MPALRAVVFRSPVVVGAVLIGVVEVVLALTTRTIGFDLWADRISGLSAASTLVGVVAAGTAAIEANRWEEANRARIRTAARPRLLVRAQHAAATVLPLVAGFWLAVAIVAVQAAVAWAYGGPSAIWLLELSASVLFAASIGSAAGAALPARWFVGPAVGIAFYALEVVLVLAGLPHGVVSLFPGGVDLDSVFVRPVARTLVAQTVFSIAASALLLLARPRRTRPRSWTRTLPRSRTTVRGATAVSGAVAVLVAAGAVNVATNGQATAAHNPGVFSCAGTRPVLCLNPGYARASAALHEPFRRLDDLTAGTPLAADRLEQNIEGVGDRPSPGSRSVYLEQWAAEDDLTFSVYRYVLRYGASSRCTTPDGSALVADVDRWLSGFPDRTARPGDSAAFRRLAALSPSAGAAWFREHSRAYAGCSLTEADLP